MARASRRSGTADEGGAKKKARRKKAAKTALAVGFRAADPWLELAAGIVAPGVGTPVYKGARNVVQLLLGHRKENIEEVVSFLKAEFERQGKTLDHLRADLEEDRAFSTLFLKGLEDAVRRPDEALRRAIVTFVARMKHSDLDATAKLEISDALARMTAPDYCTMEILERSQRSGNGEVGHSDGGPVPVRINISESLPKGRGFATPTALEFYLHKSFEWADESAVARIEAKLVGLGLVARDEHRLREPDPQQATRIQPAARHPPKLRLTVIGMKLLELTREEPPAGKSPRS